MTIKPTADNAAIVDKTYHWIDISETPPPVGPRMLLINRRQGVALISNYRTKDSCWTHWCPLPTFEEAV